MSLLLPVPIFQWFGDDGLPLTNGFVYTFAAGSSTQLATFRYAALSTPNDNPLRLDASGKATIYLQSAN